MRKFAALLGATMVAGAVAVAPAMGQALPETSFTSTAKISPKKAGTKKHPQGIKITGDLKFKTITPGVQPPIVTGGEVLLPKYGKYNGGKYKTCPVKFLRQAQPNKCPKASLMGAGNGHADADTVDAKPSVKFYNGGKSKIWAFTTLYHPALVQEPIAINIKKLSSRKWGYKVSFEVPETLQVVAGVPITLRSFHYAIGGKSYAKDFVVTTGCPKSHKYAIQGTANYYYIDQNIRTSKDYASTVACS